MPACSAGARSVAADRSVRPRRTSPPAAAPSTRPQRRVRRPGAAVDGRRRWRPVGRCRSGVQVDAARDGGHPVDHLLRLVEARRSCGQPVGVGAGALRRAAGSSWNARHTTSTSPGCSERQARVRVGACRCSTTGTRRQTRSPLAWPTQPRRPGIHPPHRWPIASRPAGGETPYGLQHGPGHNRERAHVSSREDRRPAGHDTSYDVVVIGCGFGGSASALRLTEKGYRVARARGGPPVRRRRRCPKTSWRLRTFLWAPKLGCFGIQRHSPAQGRDDPRPAPASAAVRWSTRTPSTSRSTPFYADPQWGAHHRLARRAGAVLRPGQADARRRAEPDDHAGRRGDASGGRGDGRRRHVPPDAGRRVLRRAAAGEVDDPFFGGAGPARHRLHPVRRVHDRLPARRQEHAAAELPLPGRARRRRGPSADHGDGCRARAPTAATRSTPSAPAPGSADQRRTFTADQVVLRGRHDAAPRSCCTACATPATLPDLSPRLGELTRTNSEALLGATAVPPRRSTSPRASRSRRRSTPTTTPTSSRSATARAATRWGCSPPR